MPKIMQPALDLVTKIARIPATLKTCVSGATDYPNHRKALSGEFAYELIKMNRRYLAGELEASSEKDVATILESVRAMIHCLYRMEVLKHLDEDTLKIYQHLKVTARRLGLSADVLDEVIDENLMEQLKNGEPGGFELNNRLEQAWENVVVGALHPKLQNPALVELVKMADATDSLSFWTFLIAAPSGASIETAYGYVLDLVGFYRPCELCDPLLYWTAIYNPTGCDAGFRYQVTRDQMFSTEILQHDVEKIVILGGGWLPELRHTMFGEVLPTITEIKDFLVCDNDPKVDPEIVLASGHPLLKEHVDYRKMDIATFLGGWGNMERCPFKAFKRDPAEYNGSWCSPFYCDLVQMKGVASFMPMEALIQVIIESFRHIRPGGRMMFDLQLTHFTMMRNALVFGWGGGDSKAQIQLMEANQAMRYVESVAEEVDKHLDWNTRPLVGNNNVKMVLDDPDDPVGLIVTLTNPG